MDFDKPAPASTVDVGDKHSPSGPARWPVVAGNLFATATIMALALIVLAVGAGIAVRAYGWIA